MSSVLTARPARFRMAARLVLCVRTSRLRHQVNALIAAAIMAFGLVGGVRADGVAPGHVLVRVKAGVDIRALASSYGTNARDQVPGTTLYSVEVPRNSTVAQFVNVLLADSRVTYAEADQIISSSEVGGDPFHMAFDRTIAPTTYVKASAYAQVNLGSVDAFSQVNGAQPLATGAGITVAVLDTGASFNHPALIGHYLPGYNALAPGYSPEEAADGIANTDFGHGTMIAGLIARIAPGAAIMPIRVLNGDGEGTLLGLVKGIHYATTHGARILNMSFTCTSKSGALSDALDEAEAAGVVLVAAAGNSNLNQPLAPAVSHGTIAVAAVEGDNTKSSYSNYGSYIRVVAPGTVRSAYPTGYATWAGTSFAAPFVAAEAALILSVRPTLTSEQVKSIVRSTAHSVDGKNNSYKGQLGNGIIDIEAAVKAAKK